MLHRLTAMKPWKRPSPELKGEKIHKKVNNSNDYFRDNFLVAQQKTKFQYEVKLLETHLGKQWGRFIYTVEGASAWICFTWYISMAPHSSTLAWKIPCMEEPGGLQSMGSWRVRHDWVNLFSLFTFMHWKRKWQPTPVFLPGESQGWGSLVGCRLWGRAESDTTEATQQQQHSP